MTEPTIARRCHICGATIREAALFCPQCGNELPRRDSGQTQPLVSSEAEETQRDSDETQPLVNLAAEETPRDSGETQPLVNLAAEESIPKNAAAVNDSVELGTEARKAAATDSRNTSQKQTHERTQKEAVVKAPAPEPDRASVGRGARGAVGAKIQRATTMARDVGGDMVQRGQKVREISSVVIDEAGDDPSLRFVLVAAVLFLLFLIIVLLNRFIS